MANGMGSLPTSAIIGNFRAGPNYPNLFDTEGRWFSVTFNTKEIIRLIDQETGKYRSDAFYGALKRANLRAAETVQKGMAESVRTQIGTHSHYAGPRPQRTGNRLIKSLMNAENRVVHSNNFMVGLETWMNRSPAAEYWRTIEEGMAGYDTRALFYTPGGKLASPGVGGPHMRMPQFTTLGTQGRQIGAAIHVSPIEAFNYSEGGHEAFNNLDMADLYIRNLRAAGFKNVSKKSSFFK